MKELTSEISPFSVVAFLAPEATYFAVKGVSVCYFLIYPILKGLILASSLKLLVGELKSVEFYLDITYDLM